MLEVKNLTISFDQTEVVHGISFHVDKGEIVGIIGESGSGKSVSALSVMGLLSKSGKETGEILYKGTDLNALSVSERREFQGEEISMIFQEPMTSLNPVVRIGRQVEEPLVIHSQCPKEERECRVIEAMLAAGLENPKELLNKYPHELSGGMRQRVMIAMAMICEPSLLIADEPTTALDVKLQGQILETLKDLRKERNTAIIFISHNMSIVRNFCDRIYVMHNGAVVEKGTPDDIFLHPQMDYTKRLISSIPNGKPREDSLSEEAKEVLSVRDFSVLYPVKRKFPWQPVVLREVVCGVSFDVHEGEMIGLVGQSGCGKSTLCKGILGLVDNIKGKSEYYAANGEKVDTVRDNWRKKADCMQMVFQDPYSSLNPSKKIGWILEEPLKQQIRLKRIEMTKEERKKRVSEILVQVGLEEAMADRYPRQLSGGQRQRVSIAIALIQGAKFLIADEPVSALDVTVQKQILELMLDIQKRTGIACLFISHDKAVVSQMCHRVFFMENGKITEMKAHELENA